MKQYFARNGKTLIPCDGDAEKLLDSLAQGEEVSIEVRRPRNAKWLRRYFKLLSVIAENYPEPTTTKRLDHQIKIGTNHCDTFTANGVEFKIPDSISFAAMSADEWEEFWRDAIHYACSELIPGMKEKELEAIMLTM